MSTAFDLSPTVSLLASDEGVQAANGPASTAWQLPVPTSPAGTTACDPPPEVISAPERPQACAGLGHVRALDDAGPLQPDGTPYPGDLLRDILEYRRFRTHDLAGGSLRDEQARRYEELEGLLCTSEQQRGLGRAFHRFKLRIPATLRVADGRGFRSDEVAIDNLSAGGVKLVGAKARVAGERVELVLQASGGRTIILPARVAWLADSAAVGLMFAGAARCS